MTLFELQLNLFATFNIHYSVTLSALRVIISFLCCESSMILYPVSELYQSIMRFADCASYLSIVNACSKYQFEII